MTASKLALPELRLSDDSSAYEPECPFSTQEVQFQEQEFTGLAYADLLDNLHSLRGIIIPHEHYRLYKANFEWVAGLLQSTQQLSSDTQPKSLLSMCLRKIPACIDDIEAWDARNSVAAGSHSSTQDDAALEIYQQLEAFGHHGWEPLKQTIRSHAMLKLKKAISEAVFPPDYVALLVRLCMRFNCASEASCLVTASPAVLPRPHSWRSDFTENRNMAPLHALLLETTLGGRENDQQRAHVFGCVSRLLREKRLPATWVSTRGFGAILSSCLETMALESGSPQTLELLVTIIESLYRGNSDTPLKTLNRSHDGRRLQTLIKVVSSLAAPAVLAAQAEIGETNPRTEAPQMIIRILQLLDWSANRCLGGGEPSHESDLIILVLTRYLVASGQNWVNEDLMKLQTQTEVDELLEQIQGEDTQSQLALYRKVVVLICAISQRAGEGHGTHESLFSSLCQNLDGLELPSWVRQGLIRDGPFLVAHRDADLHTLAQSRTRMPTTSPRNALSSDWRWEESISEWVPPTPTSQSLTRATKCHAHATDRASDRTARARSQTRIPAHGTDTEMPEATTTRPVAGRRTIVGNAAQGSRDSGSACPKKSDINMYRVPTKTKDAMAGVETNVAACRGLDKMGAPQRQRSVIYESGSQPFKFSGKENEDLVHMNKNDISSKAEVVLEALKEGKSSANTKRMNKQKNLLIIGDGSPSGKRPLQTRRLRRSGGGLIGQMQTAVPCDLEADWADAC